MTGHISESGHFTPGRTRLVSIQDKGTWLSADGGLRGPLIRDIGLRPLLSRKVVSQTMPSLQGGEDWECTHRRYR